MPQLSSAEPGPSVATAALDKAEVSSRRPRRGSYPPISSIPHISQERLFQAAEDARPASDQTAPGTVLYLAYGSNMSAQTFLGVRRIRPLSQVNVSVPTLRLTFDLPGVPYWEPRFANVGFRTEKPPVDPWQSGEEWDGRLMGVVYEVTRKDYRTIMRTEGAGSSYKEIIVPCIPIHSDPWTPESSKPILARTLFAPHVADDGHLDPRKCGLWYRLTTGRQRPNAGCGQASARYLKLLRDGAKEHGLPDSYQKHLASVQPYTITSWQRKLGRFLFLCTWGPLLMFLLQATNFLADETGRLPKWLAGGVAMMFNAMWMSYGAIYKPMFGDGERTMKQKGLGGRRSSC